MTYERKNDNTAIEITTKDIKLEEKIAEVARLDAIIAEYVAMKKPIEEDIELIRALGIKTQAEIDAGL